MFCNASKMNKDENRNLGKSTLMALIDMIYQHTEFIGKGSEWTKSEKGALIANLIIVLAVDS